MFNSLFNSIKSEYGILHMTSIMECLGDLIEHFDDIYVKDGNSKDAAIDSIIEILKNYKNSK